MSLFSHLPSDIQREVLYFVDDKDLNKVESKVLDNNDIFWKIKCFNGKQPCYKDIYELFFNIHNIDFLLKYGHYKTLLKTHSWNDKLAHYALKDETFLKDYIDMFDIYGETLLMYIVSCRYREDDIATLIKNGANINILNNEGKTVLFYVQDEHIAEILLKAGANPNVFCKSGYPPMVFCYRQRGVLKKLLQYGANINIQNSHGETPLILIFKRGVLEIDIVELYLNNGADKNICDKNGAKAVDYLIKRYGHCSGGHGYESLLKLLTC